MDVKFMYIPLRPKQNCPFYRFYLLVERFRPIITFIIYSQMSPTSLLITKEFIMQLAAKLLNVHFFCPHSVIINRWLFEESARPDQIMNIKRLARIFFAHFCNLRDELFILGYSKCVYILELIVTICKQ